MLTSLVFFSVVTLVGHPLAAPRTCTPNADPPYREGDGIFHPQGASRAGHTGGGDTTESPSASQVVVVELTPAQGTLVELVQREVAKAKALGRTPFIELGGPWCSICVQLKANLNDSSMIAAFHGTYIISLDYQQWTAQAAALCHLAGTVPVPVFFAMDTTGAVTHDEVDSGHFYNTSPAGMARPLQRFFRRHLWGSKPQSPSSV